MTVFLSFSIIFIVNIIYFIRESSKIIPNKILDENSLKAVN